MKEISAIVLYNTDVPFLEAYINVGESRTFLANSVEDELVSRRLSRIPSLLEFGRQRLVNHLGPE